MISETKNWMVRHPLTAVGIACVIFWAVLIATVVMLWTK